MSRLLIGLVAGGALALSAWPLRAQEQDTITARNEQKVEMALATESELEFFEVPLADVVEYVSDKHDIPVLLDLRALEDQGVTADTPITFSLTEVTLATALDLVLRPLELTWTVHRGVLVITTPEETENNLITKVYPVGDLLPANGPVAVSSSAGGLGGGFGSPGMSRGGFFNAQFSEQPGDPDAQSEVAGQESQPAGPGASPFDAPMCGGGFCPPPGPGLAPSKPESPLEQLIIAIITTVEPCDWEEVGGPGTIAPLQLPQGPVLVISQTYRTHRKVAKLLADLRAVSQDQQSKQ